MPSQENLFITPWGMAAILICSDTYHSLPSRIAALKGADLLIVPANWPPSYLFPENIWRFRALENGMWLMAANRTGADKNFNCLKSKSYVIAPNGEVICGEENPNSQVMFADIPLNALGKFEDTKRKLQILADRKPWLYYRLYANLMFFKDLTGSLSLPKPNPFDLWFVAQGKNLSPLDYIETRLPSIMVGTGMVLPLRDYSDVELSRLETISKENGVIILAAREVRSTRELLVFENQERKTVPFLDTELPPLVHVGPAAILPVKAKDLFHPELALSAAKLGADLLLANEDTLGEYDRFTVSMRPIDQLAVAVCANDGAAIGLIPEGHVPGRGAYTQEGSHFTYTLDTRDTRQKHFQDRIDYPVLFESSEDRLKAFLKEGKNL
jgi:predicted amidohydrolase